MSLDDKVIIEVALNETVFREQNPHVPYAPDEIARDAQRCQDVGAAVVHYHARDLKTAELSSDIELNLSCQRGITESSSLIAYPTYGDCVPVPGSWYEVCSPAPQRYAHFVRGVVEEIRFEVGPIDLGAFFDINAVDLRGLPEAQGAPGATSQASDARDVRAARSREIAVDLLPNEELGVDGWGLMPGYQINNGYDHVWLLRFCRKYDLHPSFAAPDTSALLNLRNLVDMGLVPERDLTLKLFFWGDQALRTRFRGMRDLALELFPEKVVRLTPVVHGADGLSLAEHAMSVGCDARTGIGDSAHHSAGTPTNAELVEGLVKLARSMGREPATPDEARELKGMRRLAVAI